MTALGVTLGLMICAGTVAVLIVIAADRISRPSLVKADPGYLLGWVQLQRDLAHLPRESTSNEIIYLVADACTMADKNWIRVMPGTGCWLDFKMYNLRGLSDTIITELRDRAERAGHDVGVTKQTTIEVWLHEGDKSFHVFVDETPTVAFSV